MKALEQAMKSTGEEVMSKIQASGIKEYGLCSRPLSELLKAAEEEGKELGKETGVVAALNNADTDRVLLELLRQDPESVMEGISILAYALHTEKKSLHIPEEEEELKESLKDIASQYQVALVSGIVNVRASKGDAVVHIVTAKDVADVFAETFAEGVYVSVNGAPLKKVACDEKISAIAETEGAKGLLFGYRYHGTEDAELTAGEAGITNGVLCVLTEKDCIVSQTQKKLLDSRKTSCGKCVFCREGLIQLEYMQKETTEGRGKMEYLELTKEIGEAMCYSTPCTMGQVSAEIALSATELFAGEYESHIKKKKCPAGTCTSFVNIYIDPTLCNGCGECMDVCPKDCIEGKAKYIHMIDDFDCTKCGKCMEVCEEEAIVKTTGKLPKLPTRLVKVGKFKKR